MATHYNFSDIFVSYAHVDRDFVKPITGALSERGYEIWIDWEDIPQTADWWQEIEAGIDASNTFVFFVSPASAQSEICYREVQYAVDNNKRIVPILCESISDNALVERLHPAIRIHNWLLFDDATDFENNIQRLINTLTLELSHLRLHTRYLVRAREWDEREKASSFLLRGMDAIEAISWLQGSYSKEPAPLALHQAYIEACQQQLQIDERLAYQQRALLFVERRTLPAFFTGFFVIAYYVWIVHPDTTLIGLDRLELSIGIGAAFGSLLAALALYAHELISIRFSRQFYLRVGMGLLFSLIFSMTSLGVLQAAFNNLRLDMLSLFIAWLLFGSSFYLGTIFKLKGWQEFILAFITIYPVIYFFSTTADTGWQYPVLPIFYFETTSQRLTIGLPMSLLFALGSHGWLIVQDILQLLPENIQERFVVKRLID